MKDKLKVEDTLINILKKEVKPAIGCTEPISVAYAAAVARQYSAGIIKKLTIKTSLNIYKNGKSVIIPGTDRCGLKLAGALGFLIGDASKGLCVLENVKNTDLNEAENLVNKSIIFVEPIDACEGIYIEVISHSENDVKVIISKCHTHIESIQINDKYIFKEASDFLDDDAEKSLLKLSFKDIKEIVEKIHIGKISFMLDGVDMNMMAAEEGLKRNFKFNIGSGLMKLQKSKKISEDPAMSARILTAAGADFRMGGGNLPVMTSGGSGNQGLGIIIPIVVMGKKLECSQDELCRALFFAHAVNILVKSHVGKLSSLCGCAIAAGVGAAAGITYLMNGNDEQIEGAMQNMLANLTGMICDGAKESCAMKLSTSAGEAVLSSYLACSNIIVPKKTGIIGDTVLDTINNLHKLCVDGLNKTEQTLVDILYEQV